jgi:hypothetical protein
VLQYSINSGAWTSFPASAAAATFFSANDDTTCVSSFTDVASVWQISCSDNSKFAPAGTFVVNFRYSAQWTTVSNAPAAAVYVTANTNLFSVTIKNKCNDRTLTMANPPAT